MSKRGHVSPLVKAPQDQKGHFSSDFSFGSFFLTFLVNFLILLANFRILFTALVNFLFGELPDFLLVSFHIPAYICSVPQVKRVIKVRT